MFAHLHTIRAAALCAIVAVTVTAGCAEKESTSAARQGIKNLLIICIDTVRADTFFHLAGRKNDNLAAWEDKAVVFSNAHAPSPWTVPSIASFFTGLWPAQHGAGLFAGMYGQINKVPPSRYREGVPSLPLAAKAAGYDTAAVSASAWTNNTIYRSLMEGFDTVVPYDTPGADADWRPLLATWRDELLPSAEGKRFMHFIHLMEAHNWHALTKGNSVDALYAALTEEQLLSYRDMQPPNACDTPTSAFCKSFNVYASAVTAIRDGIAEVLATLERQNLLDDTLVVVFSDHGEEFLDHLGDRRSKSAKNLVAAMFGAYGHGMTLYEEQLHVPLLMWHPGVEPATIDAPVSLVDVAPSVAQWMGIDYAPEDWPGRSLETYVSGGPALERTLYGSAVSQGEKQLSARKDNEKAIWYQVTDVVDYYALDEDPGETTSAPSDERILRFDGLFVDHQQWVSQPAVSGGDLSEEQVRRLQSIGYLQGVDAEAETEPASQTEDTSDAARDEGN